MAKQKFLTKSKYRWTEEEQKRGSTKFKKPTLTREGKALTVRQILTNSANGLDFEDVKTPFYEDEATFSTQDFNKIQQMDFAERQQYYEKVSKQAKDLSKKIQHYNERKKQEASEQQAQEAAARAQEPTPPKEEKGA